MWRYVVNIPPLPHGWKTPPPSTQGGLPVGSARGTWELKTRKTPGVQRLHGWRFWKIPPTVLLVNTSSFMVQFPCFFMFMFTRGIYDLDPDFFLPFYLEGVPHFRLVGLRITMVKHFPRPGMIIQVGGKFWIGTYRNFGRTHKSTASPPKKKICRWFPEN